MNILVCPVILALRQGRAPCHLLEIGVRPFAVGKILQHDAADAEVIFAEPQLEKLNVPNFPGVF